MKAIKQKHLNARNFVIILFILFIALGMIYKYFEWSTLQSLASLYNQTWTQEIGMVQDENKNAQPYIQLNKKVFGKNASSDSLINSYDELTGDLQLVISSQENYKSTIEQNESAYENINTWFLFGQRGDFAKNLVLDQLKYYKYEINDANITDADDWLTYDVITVLRDSSIIAKFSKETGYDYKVIPQYWSELAPLQKYTNSDFTFEHQDDIKTYYPHAYGVLKQYQQYFSDFYSTMQDDINGDYQSVAYKIPTLQQTGSSLNISFSDLFSEEKDQSNQNATNIIQLVSKQENSVKDFIAQGLYKYPLLPNINTNWKDDLVLCQMYDFKASMYHSVSTNYIKSNNPKDLLNELSTVSPDTRFVDSRFNKSSMTIENNDSKIVFTCKDKTTNESYQFITVK